MKFFLDFGVKLLKKSNSDITCLWCENLRIFFSFIIKIAAFLRIVNEKYVKINKNLVRSLRLFIFPSKSKCANIHW